MTTTRRPVRRLVRRRLFMNAKKVAPLNLSASRQNWNLPSRNRTAPKYPTLRRVGACRKTESLVSGGIHIWQREPCCWKCTSSVAQRSTSRLASAFGVFFMRLLPFRIGLGNAGARRAPPKTQLPEQTLALTDSQVSAILFRHPGRQGLAVPQSPAQSHIAGRLAKSGIDSSQLLLIQATGPPGAFPLPQSRQSTFLETPDPILH